MCSLKPDPKSGKLLKLEKCKCWISLEFSFINCNISAHPLCIFLVYFHKNFGSQIHLSLLAPREKDGRQTRTRVMPHMPGTSRGSATFLSFPGLFQPSRALCIPHPRGNGRWGVLLGTCQVMPPFPWHLCPGGRLSLQGWAGSGGC